MENTHEDLVYGFNIRLFVCFSRVVSFPSFVCSVLLLLLLFVYCVVCPRFSVILGLFLCIVFHSAFASLLTCCFISRSLVFHLSYLTVSGLSCFLVALSLLSCLSCCLVPLRLRSHSSHLAVSFLLACYLIFLTCCLISLGLPSRFSHSAISSL